MLVYYSAENFRSIDAPIELNMKAENRLRRHKSHTVNVDQQKNINVLRSSVMYGANASGKSNIIKSISFAKDLIVLGAGKAEGFDCEKFLLDTEARKLEPSSFYFEFTDNLRKGSHRYFAYGFRIDEKRILEESLFEVVGNSEICIFERKYDEGRYVTKTDIVGDDEGEDIADFIRLMKYTADNQLFLNEYRIKNIHEKIESTSTYMLPAMLFFWVRLTLIYPISRYGGLHNELNDSSDNSYLDAITKFDTGVCDISFKDIPLSHFPEEFIDFAKERLEREPRFDKESTKKVELEFHDEDYVFKLHEDNSISVQKYMSVHNSNEGNVVKFDLENESDGTRRLLDLIPALCGYRKGKFKLGSVYVIDEFDRSLHPLLARKFLELFLSSEYGVEEDQLIVTTHESGLLDNELLRRDEIWFVQKENDQSTHLYSLNEYSTRFDKDIEKAYLQGRFGAIPNLVHSALEV
ncbi:AAA family ATPase [Reinekea blandensis]|uniref:Transporter n=1 Tax=Reinekea blandensis MED297 TaxID=314283 RepID=A4B8W2_9GAMM|nr:ATP-binding protein [Reinekea blandensis]EAR11063.1 Transporter [Reinekea sp. MED297] [Reinekea blandensis MED297]